MNSNILSFVGCYVLSNITVKILSNSLINHNFDNKEDLQQWFIHNGKNKQIIKINLDDLQVSYRERITIKHLVTTIPQILAPNNRKQDN